MCPGGLLNWKSGQVATRCTDRSACESTVVLLLELPVGEGLRSRDDAFDVGIDAVVPRRLGRLALLHILTSRRFLLTSLVERLLPFALRRCWSCVACHARTPHVTPGSSREAESGATNSRPEAYDVYQRGSVRCPGLDDPPRPRPP